MKHVFADLGVMPISNNFLRADQLSKPELFYPLRASVDMDTKLVQLDYPLSPGEMFNEKYPYFSGQSTTWLHHLANYVDEMIDRFQPKFVAEIGSNDGCLLQIFKDKGVWQVQGVEPSLSVATVARSRGIPTQVSFFGYNTVLGWKDADLIVANNVLAHVPDIDDFVSGFTKVLAPNGVVTFEFPWLLNLIEKNQFDTIYHEHYSYLSFMAVQRVLARNHLRAFDVQKIPTHGGSLRVFACHAAAIVHARNERIDRVIGDEVYGGLDRKEVYQSFCGRINVTKRSLLELLIEIKRDGLSIAAYGAPAKGNTLLNYCGIGKDFVDFVVDTTPAKQRMFLPGTRLEIWHPDKLALEKPDFILILPWNFKNEIMDKLRYTREWGCKFIVPIPRAEVI
jgi:SAM-dependent methyltransferase